VIYQAPYTHLLAKPKNFSRKKVFAFDIDNTLTESRGQLTEEHARILESVLETRFVVILTGGSYEHVQEQVLSALSGFCAKEKIIIFPSSGAACFTLDHAGRSTQRYSYTLTAQENERIVQALKQVLQSEHKTEEDFLACVDMRGSSVTYSGCGQDALFDEKKKYDPDRTRRGRYQRELRKLLPDFEISIGGLTSLDITRKGISKFFALSKLVQDFPFKKDDILFFGDAVFSGGNDSSVPEHGIDTVAVSSPLDTFHILECLHEYPVPYDEKRPWGSFKQIVHNKPSTVKLIHVKKGEELSWQYHNHRAELWKILSGSPVILLHHEWVRARAGDEFFIPQGMTHSIGAPEGDVLLLEVAVGHFDEEDIVRLKDRYSRS
jgi:phosphomannomutase